VFSSSAKDKLRILIVDDQMFNLEALSVILKVCGIDTDSQVHRAFNGLQAVK